MKWYSALRLRHQSSAALPSGSIGLQAGHGGTPAGHSGGSLPLAPRRIGMSANQVMVFVEGDEWQEADELAITLEPGVHLFTFHLHYTVTLDFEANLDWSLQTTSVLEWISYVATLSTAGTDREDCGFYTDVNRRLRTVAINTTPLYSAHVEGMVSVPAGAGGLLVPTCDAFADYPTTLLAASAAYTARIA